MGLVRNRRVIDLGAVRSNMISIRRALPSEVRVMAVVKADAYGHGAVECARAALQGGADMLAVASVQEGILLRDAGISAPVLVLGAVTASDAAAGIEYSLIQTVCSPDMIRICEKNAGKNQKQTEVHLKIDTGMGRIGIRTREEMDQMLSVFRECPHVKLTGVFTHFSDADGDEDGIRYTKSQFRRFLELSDVLPREVIRHCSNSAAIHRFPEMRLDMVRVGISLYGYPPVPVQIPLIPVMTWTAKISFVKTLPPGEYVSYGRTYRTEKAIRAATVTCGYADGYHRAAGPQGYVLIRGKKCKIIGRVCMDQMIADVTSLPEVHPGDKVTLLGRDGKEEISAEDIARWAGTISYEVLLSAGSRVEREFDDHEREV